MTEDRPAKHPRLDSTPRKIPREVLLLNVPALIAHPPNHSNYVASLKVSLEALNKCVAFAEIEPEVECRAWTGIAEISILLNMSELAEKAITKGLVIAQKHPSLKLYYPRLILLSARISTSPKYAQNTLRRFLDSATPALPIHFVYTAHLDLITSLSSTDTSKTLSAIQALQELAEQKGHEGMLDLTTLLRVQTLVNAGWWSHIQNALPPFESIAYTQPTEGNLSERLNHRMNPIIQAHVLILMVIYHTYINSSDDVVAVLRELHLLLDSGKVVSTGPSKAVPPAPLGTPYQRSIAEAAEVGIIQVFPGVFIQSTHPRVLFLLVFLITSVAKRDPVGRKPKKRVFAVEGLKVLKREREKERDRLCGGGLRWTTIGGQVQKTVEDRLDRLEADMLSELVSIAIMRCEFGEAERVMNTLTAHVRSCPLSRTFQTTSKTLVVPTQSSTPPIPSLFHSYAARITLHHAHLWHAKGGVELARQYYQLASWLSSQPEMKDFTGAKPNALNTPLPVKPKAKKRKRGRKTEEELPTAEKEIEPIPNFELIEGEGRREDPWINACARAGGVALRLGILGQKRVDRALREKEKLRGKQRISGRMVEDSDWDVDMSSDAPVLEESSLASDEDEETDNEEQKRQELMQEAQEEELLRREALQVAEQCDSLGGTLCATAEVLRACAATEYLKGKNHLRHALTLATSAQDNHLRALILALVASRYVYTAKEHAEGMLRVCETLGAGVGAGPSPSSTSIAGDNNKNLDSQMQSQVRPDSSQVAGDRVGNARLRLWVGERLLDLHRWAGEKDKATRQRKINEKLGAAVMNEC